MSDSKRDRPLRQILREDAEPCVWMSAGQVAYKLCDREFRCEECPLDACFRGEGNLAGSRAAAAPGPAQESGFPEDRRYDPGHTWAGVVSGNRIRVGLDSFAAHLLRHVSGVVLPPPGGRLTRGHFGCWVTDDDVTLSLKSPVSGTVVRSNPRLLASPALAAESPYADGWLLEVACDDPEGAVAGLLGASEIRDRSRADVDRLRDLSLGALDRGEGPSVGPALVDGSEPEDLRRLLGPAGFYRIVARLLG
jgi:glycine cleavage system H protein